jgi:hypothetical protein
MMRLYCSVLLTIFAATILPLSSDSVGYNFATVRTSKMTTENGRIIMLLRGDVATIRAEIERLENALKECTDSGIRKQIEVWIDDDKRKLLSGEIPSSPRKPTSKSDGTGKSLR